MPEAKTPAPISWSPSQYWDGIDGNWSSFDLRVGTPEQMVRVLPSTAASATWVVITGGCDPPSLSCSDARGGLFDYNQSSSWGGLGMYTLDLEQNLGRNESGIYGTDTLSLGMNNATGGPTLHNQTIAGIETSHYYTGVFGLSREPMHLDNLTSPRDSFLTSLKKLNMIPSLSWAYTAGAHYQSKGVLGSLTLGGSDLSRYTPSNLSFNLAPDSMRDLVVGLQSITSTYANGSSSILLPSPILTFIDSTVPYIYLPAMACELFEASLGLVWNESLNLYLVDQELHQNLLNTDPQFTFRIGNDKTSKSTVDINLPYASFDLMATPPLFPENTSYFPIRRAKSDDQLTLGRVFLQEAYIITDYDQKNFTVAQSRFDDTAEADLVPIPWNATTASNLDGHLSRRTTISISVGTVSFALLILLSLAFWFRKRWVRNNVQRPLTPVELSPPDYPHEMKAFSTISMQEIGNNSVHEAPLEHDAPRELHNMFQVELLDKQSPSGSGNELKELVDKASSLHSRRDLTELPSWTRQSRLATGNYSGRSSTRDAHGNAPSTRASQSGFWSARATHSMSSSTHTAHSKSSSRDADTNSSTHTAHSNSSSTRAVHTNSSSTLAAHSNSSSTLAGQASIDASPRSAFNPTSVKPPTRTSPNWPPHLSPHLSPHLGLNLNKTLPQVPAETFGTAVPVPLFLCRSISDRKTTHYTPYRSRPSLARQHHSEHPHTKHLTPPSTLIDESMQVSPVGTYFPRVTAAPRRGRWVDSWEERGASTYAAHFDYDSYRDSVVVSEREVEMVER